MDTLPNHQQTYGDPRAIRVGSSDFARGSLRLTSYIRPGKLFTAHATLVAGHVGELQSAKFSAILEAVAQIIKPKSKS